MQLLLDRYSSPVGPLRLVMDVDGVVRALDFADFEPRMHRLLRAHYDDVALKNAAAPLAITEALDAYFEGDLTALDEVPVATGGTSFQREVWRALREIPAGTTESYGQLATRIGHPGSARAVGAANGSNPIAIIVPCHRVIGADGSLTGFGGGIQRKRWLLDHERQSLRVPALSGALQ